MKAIAVGSPIFLLLAIVVGLATAWCITRLSHFYREQIDGLGENRYETLDGLRGFAAFGVFLSHMVLTQHFHATGDWSWTGWEHGGAARAGGVGVYFFFMLTGFLFWGRLLDSGRSIDWSKLFEGRIRRIVPLYLFAVFLVLFIVAIKTHFTLNVHWKVLLAQISTWLSFKFVDLRDINGLKYSSLIGGGVYWTLAYEWRFYISLPFLAFFLSRGRFLFLGVVGGLLAWLATIDFIYLCFLAGMTSAYLVRIQWLRELARKPVMTGLVFAALFAIFYFEYESGWRLILHVFIIFSITSLGNSMGGLLLSRSAKLLGLISYSVYLLHLTALYVFGEVMSKIVPIKFMPVEVYWMWMVPLIVVVIGGSAITYRFVEYPLMRGGGRLRSVRAAEGRVGRQW